MTDKKDLGAQIEFSASADGMKPGVDAANKSIASIGATAEYVGNKADASLGKLGGSAEKSAKQIAAATRSISAQADRALASFDAGGSLAARLEINAKRAGANLEKLADKIALVRAAEEAANARVAARSERDSSARAAVVGHGAASSTFAEAQSRVYLAFKVAEQAAINQAAAAQAHEASVLAAVAAASDKARTAQQAAYETKVAYIAKVNEEGAALFRTKEAQRALDAERAGVGPKDAAYLAKTAGDREFIAGIYRKIEAEQKLSTEFGKSTSEVLRLQAAERGLINTTESAIGRYEALAKANKEVADAAARRKQGESLLAQINNVAAGINADGTAKSRAELLALRAAEAGVGKEAEAALKKIALLDAGTGQLGKSAFSSRNRLLTLQYTISDVIASAGSGISPLTILLQQGGQVFDAFGGANAREGAGFFKSFFGTIASFITPARLAIGGVVGVLGTLAVAYHEGSKQSKAFADSLVLTGGYAGATEGQFNALAKSIAASTNFGVSAAREFTQALIATGEIGPRAFDLSAEAATRYGNATGKAAKDVAAEFAALNKDTYAGATKLNQTLNFLSTAQIQQIRRLQDAGQTNEAYALTIGALNDRLKGLEANFGTIERATVSVGNFFKDMWDRVLDVGRETTIEDKIEAARARLEAARRLPAGAPTIGPYSGPRPSGASVVESAGEDYRFLNRVKSAKDQLALDAAATREIEKKGAAASEYYRAAEQSAKTQAGLTRELANEERQYQALVAARAKGQTDSEGRLVELPSDDVRKATQKRIRDNYTDRSGAHGLREQGQIEKATRDQAMKALDAMLSAERAAYQFHNSYLQSLYSQGLVSLDDYYAQRREAADRDDEVQQKHFAGQIATLQKYLAATKDPSERISTQTAINDTQAQADAARIENQRRIVIATQEEEAARKQLNDRVTEYRASLLQLAGDEEGAARIRTNLAIANAKLLATTAGGAITDEQLANQERLLTIAYKLNEVQRKYNSLISAASAAEEAYILLATERGQSLLETERGIYAIRAKALAVLVDQAAAAKALADASGNTDDYQRAADMALQVAKAVESVDPALNRLRENAKDTADAIAEDIGAAIDDFKGFGDLAQQIGNDLKRQLTKLLVTEPLKVSVRAVFQNITEGDNPVAKYFKDILGIQAPAQVAQTAAVNASTNAMTQLAISAEAAAQTLASMATTSGTQTAGNFARMFGQFLGGVTGSNPNGFNGSMNNPSAYVATPHAKGGVFSSPTLFRFASGAGFATGVMGEAGPEAVMPLRRGANGSLGVVASGGNTFVTVNNNASGTKASATESRRGNGDKEIMVLIEEVVASSMNGGRIGDATQRRFGLNPGGSTPRY